MDRTQGDPPHRDPQIVTMPPYSTRERDLEEGVQVWRDWKFVKDMKILYFVGKITYFDGQHTKHTTTFCIMNKVWWTNSQFDFCPSGNNMD
jgi:hypothetical protein